MWANNQSIAKEKAVAGNFIPPYCANPFCAWHQPSAISSKKPFHKFGIKKIARWPYFNQRFRCKKCLATFAQSFFTLSYRDKRADSYEEIHDLLLNGYSGCAVARKLKIHEDTVRRRKKKLARWALLEWAKDLERVRIKESVAFDGLENFAYSQFDPNNLNHAVGRESYFIYDFNLSPMNRRGKKSPRQKAEKAALEETFGKYDGRAIEKGARRVFERLLARADGDLHLHSDNHYAYRRAIRRMPDGGRIIHAITPAKLARNFRNRLFAINHTDMLTRHQLSAFKRETIAFSKHTIGMIESFTLFCVQKNYMRPKFYKMNKRDPRAHLDSPAVALGLRKKIQTFREFYRERPSVHHVRLSEDWQDYFDSTDLSSRRCIRPYGGI